MESLLGTYDLNDAIANYPEGSTYTSLNATFDGQDPGQYLEIPLEKGFQFLYYIE